MVRCWIWNFCSFSYIKLMIMIVCMIRICLFMMDNLFWCMVYNFFYMILMNISCYNCNMNFIFYVFIDRCFELDVYFLISCLVDNF